MKIKGAQLRQELGRRGAPTLATVVGSDDFLRREAVELLLSHVEGGPPVGDQVTRLQGDRSTGDGQLTALFDEVRTPSLFGGPRAIVVAPAEPYLVLDPDSWVSFVEGGWTGAILVLVVDALDGRRKLSRKLAEGGWVIEVAKPFHRPPPWQRGAKPWQNPLNHWLCERAKREGTSLDPPTAHLLMSRVGTSLADLAAALERIVTSLPAGAAIDRERVEQLTPDGEESTLFDLVDAFFGEEREVRLRQVRDLLHRGSVDSRGQRTTDPGSLLLQFVGAAVGRARQLRDIHRVQAEGGGDDEILRTAGVPKFLLPRLKEQARHSPPPRLRRVVEALSFADEALKGGRGPEAGELLERIVAGV